MNKITIEIDFASLCALSKSLCNSGDFGRWMQKDLMYIAPESLGGREVVPYGDTPLTPAHTVGEVPANTGDYWEGYSSQGLMSVTWTSASSGARLEADHLQGDLWSLDFYGTGDVSRPESWYLVTLLSLVDYDEDRVLRCELSAPATVGWLLAGVENPKAQALIGQLLGAGPLEYRPEGWGSWLRNETQPIHR